MIDFQIWLNYTKSFLYILVIFNAAVRSNLLLHQYDNTERISDFLCFLMQL